MNKLKLYYLIYGSFDKLTMVYFNSKFISKQIKSLQPKTHLSKYNYSFEPTKSL